MWLCTHRAFHIALYYYLLHITVDPWVCVLSPHFVSFSLQRNDIRRRNKMSFAQIYLQSLNEMTPSKEFSGTALLSVLHTHTHNCGKLKRRQGQKSHYHFSFMRKQLASKTISILTNTPNVANATFKLVHLLSNFNSIWNEFLFYIALIRSFVVILAAFLFILKHLQRGKKKGFMHKLAINKSTVRNLGDDFFHMNYFQCTRSSFLSSHIIPLPLDYVNFRMQMIFPNGTNR